MASITTPEVQSAPRSSSRGAWLLLAGRLALGAVFLFAAWQKMPWREPWQLFAMKVSAYQVPLPLWLINTIARGLPWLEAALGLALILGWLLRLASLGASALLLGFFALMVYSYAHGLAIDCGCGLPGGDALGPKTLVRDGAIAALAVAITVGAFLRARRKKPTGPIP